MKSCEVMEIRLFMNTPIIPTAGSVFNTSPDLLVIGNIIARGSPGVVVYDADLRVGPRTTKVHVCSVISKDLVYVIGCLSDRY